MAEIKAIIKGENQITSAVKSAENDLNGFQQAASKVGTALKSAFAVGAVIAALKKMGDAVSACFNEFSQAERSYKQLAIALNDTAGYEKVVDNIQALSRVTLSSKGDIEAMAAELAALGKGADEINQISSAAVALSNVTGKDLNSSMTTLLNTYRGTTTQLNKIGIDTSNLTKEELEQGAAVQLVIDKFSDLSEQMAADDMKQSIQNIKTTFTDIKQHIGGIFEYSFSDLFKNIDTGFRGVYDNITKGIDWIAATIKNFPAVIKALAKAMGETLLTIFSWDFIKGRFKLMVDNITAVIQGLIQIIPKSIPQIFSFIFNKALSLIDGIVAWLLDKMEDALEAIVNAFARSKLGQWLGVKEVKINLGAEKLEQSSAERDETANAAIAQLADNAAGIWDTVKETAGTIKDQTAQFFDEQLGDTWREFGSSFMDIVKPTFDEIQEQAEATKKAATYITETVDESVSQITDAVEDGVDDVVTKVDDLAAKQAEAFKTSVVNSVSSNLGETGSLLSKALNNIQQMGLIAGIIATAIEYIAKGLSPEFLAALDKTTSFVTGPLAELGHLISDILLPITEMLAPVLQFFGAVVMFISQNLRHMIASVVNWFAGTGLGKTLGVSKLEDPGWTSFSSAYDSLNYAAQGSELGSSTSTAISNASYRGGTSVTINIYQEAPVVGDGGMTTFAQMIREKFMELDYYGV